MVIQKYTKTDTYVKPRVFVSLSYDANTTDDQLPR